jgi:hypothetical protein
MKDKIEIWGEFEAASPKERQEWMRMLLAEWEQNYLRRCQLDSEADQRAFQRGSIDPPGPIDNQIGIQSSTNRVPK